MAASVALHYRPEDSAVGEILRAALVRSFSAAQVRVGGGPAEVAVLLHAGPQDRPRVDAQLSDGGKLLLLGRLDDGIAACIGVRPRPLPALAPEEWVARVDPSTPADESPAALRWDDAHPLAAASPFRRRAFCRFDFADEWNNQGFGRIGPPGSPWSLAMGAEPDGARVLARVEVAGEGRDVFAALHEGPHGSALWLNRAVGLVDSLEWHLVEAFVGDHRPDDRVCLPYLLDVPRGFTAAATLRLDCDEAVASAAPLVSFYGSRGVPLSLALLTGQELGDADRALLREVAASGGSVVSHSVRHAPSWGADYEQALRDARESRDWIETHVPEAAPVRFAVSPFHQNPAHAVRALGDAGYAAFVGGSIAWDPEFLVGRSGRVPGADVVTHSQQCMLHGDCWRRQGKSIDMWSESFERHAAVGALFGALDHPFSERYQYGWESESERIGAHAALLDRVLGDGVWLPSLGEALAFLVARADSTLELADGRVRLAAADPARPPRVRWRGAESL